MDPLTVLRTMWHHKAAVIPVMVITLLAAAYVFQFGPRYYQSTLSYALVNPKLPTEKDIDAHPELSALNSDNPFLRSSDPALITEVLIARLNSKDMGKTLEDSGLSSDYSVARGINGNGFVVTIAGTGDSEALAYETTKALGKVFEENLRAVQKVNGAEDRFLFTAFVVNPSDKATEQFSSRLRSVIMVLLGGAVLMFGAVSLARSVETMRSRRSSGLHSDAGRQSKDDRSAADQVNADQPRADVSNPATIMSSAAIRPVKASLGHQVPQSPGTRAARNARVEEVVRSGERVRR
ncbi:chain-length determining protein [Arthrobacter sp. BE255]|uniref:chain-length determining protein n=1 Tax=Arthrobacter sp. BE255 TaxID=2817721 RepID=UPI002855BA57|nr:chain-length determining protein [Arthrobacter sp. BE255]MDR7160367.1 hypothetical protein [Arthrobacter sp. BE255]